MDLVRQRQRGPHRLNADAIRRTALSFDVLATTNGGKTWQPEVIDGGDGELVLATAGHDYYVDRSSQGDDNTSAVFSSSNLGLSPQASHLTITIGPKTLKAAVLKKKHRTGSRSRASSPRSRGEPAGPPRVSQPNKGWTQQPLNVATSGAFQVTIKNVKSTTDFVVYAVGDGVHGGAEGYARLTVK